MRDQTDGVVAWVRWVLRNGPRYRPVLPVLQVLVGLLFAVLGYRIGRVHFHLIVEGRRAEGRIIRYQEEHHDSRNPGGTSVSSSAFHPVVEFTAGNRIIHFENRAGSANAGGLNDPVPVLYDSERPVDAMIDRQILNWMPWAPMFVLGAFLLLTGARGSLTRRPETVTRTSGAP